MERKIAAAFIFFHSEQFILGKLWTFQMSLIWEGVDNVMKRHDIFNSARGVVREGNAISTTKSDEKFLSPLSGERLHLIPVR